MIARVYHRGLKFVNQITLLELVTLSSYSFYIRYNTKANGEWLMITSPKLKETKMKYDWLDEYALSLLGASKDFKQEWGAVRYLIGNKMFAYRGEHKDGRPLITLKGDPAENEDLRAAYEDIIPGYYANKVVWNSIYLDGKVPEKLLKELVMKAYTLLLNSLPKKQQAEILGQK